MNHGEVTDRPWPPAFSDTFLDDAHALLRKSGHVMIVGPLGSHRGALAAALAGPSAPTSWGRDAQFFSSATKCYAAVNQLLPDLQARADQPLSEVSARAETVVSHAFGRPTMSLQEADLCDNGSIEVLAHLIGSGLIRLVSTVGPDTADDHPFASTAARIDLEPLDHDSIARLLTDRFGATPHHTTVSMLAERSQGAYAVLKELADAGFATGQIKTIAGNLVTDETISVETVHDVATATSHWPPRFAADHPARDLIDVTALAMSLDRSDAQTLFGDDAISAALALGALRANGGWIDFASHIEAMILQRQLSTDRRTELHSRYAGQLSRSALLGTTAPQVAQWSLSVGAPLPPGLAVHAASQANREGRYHVALQFVEAISQPDRPSRLLIEQCHALSESGDQTTLLALLKSIDATSLDDADLFPYLRWASRYLPFGEVSDIVVGVRDKTDANDHARAAVLTMAELIDETYQDDSENCRHSLMALAMSGRLSPINQAMARSAVATSLRQNSRTDQAVELADSAADVLLADPEAATCDVEAALEAQIMCHLTAGDFDGARAALIRYSQPAIEFGNSGRLGTVLWGVHAFFSGDLGVARAHAELCLARIPASDPHLMRGWMEAITAQILIQVGDLDHVSELLAASRQHDRNPWRHQDLGRRIAQACVYDAIGEPEDALELLQGVVDEAHEHGLTLAEVDAAVLCVQIGGPVHLNQLLRAVESVDESCGTSWIWKRFAWAIRDNAMRDLVTLAEELDTAGLALFAAEVAQFTLDIARRAADMAPEQRQRLVAIADPMQHRHVAR